MMEDLFVWLAVVDMIVFAFACVSNIIKQWFDIAVLKKTHIIKKRELQ